MILFFAWINDLSFENLAGFFDRRDLQIGLRSKMGKETAFAHPEVACQAANRESIQSLR